MINRIVLGLIGFTAAILIVVPGRTSAHVLITDTGGTVGAVLHVMPDDDPVAGEPSEFFLDIQTKATVPGATVFTITGPDGRSRPVDVATDGSLVSAKYTFPTQGLYRMIFRTTLGDTPYTFEHAQRVTRGVSGSASYRPTHAWAEAGAIALAAGMATLGIIAVNRRTAIKAYSKL